MSTKRVYYSQCSTKLFLHWQSSLVLDLETHPITHMLGQLRVLLHQCSCSLLELRLGEDVRDEAPVETLLRTHWLAEEEHLGGLKSNCP